MFRRNRPDQAAEHACRCAHAHEAHIHYRSGSDCGICGPDLCAKYRADKHATALTRFPASTVTVAPADAPAALTA